MLNKIKQSFDANFNTMELILIFVLNLSLMAQRQELEGAKIIFLFTSSLLAIIYVFKGYVPLENHSAKSFYDIVKLSNWQGSAICVLGLMFYFLNYPGYRPMLLIGFSSLLLMILPILYFNIKGIEPKIFNLRAIVRSVLLIGLTVICHSPETFFKL